MPYLKKCKSVELSESRNDCSEKALLNYIYANLRYPPNAVKYGIEGIAITQFVIKADGSVSSIEVVQGVCDDFKRECERLFSNMPEWESGTINGEKVDVLKTMPIKFKLYY